jgi:polysaccharide biosynthesis protein PslH
MRILFVAPYLPSTVRYRSYRFIEGLHQLGHRVTLVAVAAERPQQGDTEASRRLAEICEATHIVPLTPGRALYQSVIHVGSGTPLAIAPYAIPALVQEVERITRQTSFDIAHVEHLRVAHVAEVLRPTLPVVFDAVDCLTEQQRLRLPPSISRGLDAYIGRYELSRFEHYEPRSAARFDRVIISSEVAARRLTDLLEQEGLDTEIDVVPNGVDLEYFRPMQAVPVRPASIAFPGRFAGKPDRDAAAHFCREIFPGIKNLFPLATVCFIGSDPPPAFVQEMAADHTTGVEVVSQTFDIRPHVARAAVAVCPLRMAGGSRNRLLQIMAMGKAVVASPQACEAVDPNEAGHTHCLADTPLAFATQIMHLFNHAEEANRLGWNARQYVEERHNWEKIVPRLVNLYRATREARASRAA